MTDNVNELEIQRCVDGELSDDQQRALLTRLEGTPDGWRLLALAFVEYQVWGEGCRAVVGAIPAQTSLCARGPVRSTARWLAAAAAVVIAVGVGFTAGQRWGSGPMGPLVAGAGAATGDSARAERPAPEPVMNLEFVRDGDSTPEMTIPVFDRQDLGAEYWDEPDIVPADVRQALFRRGYDVRQQREFVSIPLSDGRQIAVPVDTVLMSYRGL
jgi:hypothetical protein